MSKKYQIRSQALITLFCLILCLGSFASSFISVCLTQIAPFLTMKNNLSLHELVKQLTFATSSFNFGSIVGPFFYQFVSPTTKKKFTIRQKLVFIDILTLLFLSIQLFHLKYEVLVFCRFNLGIIIGISTSLIPKYINIISPVQIAGKMGTFNQLLQTSGVLFSCVLGFMVIQPKIEDQLMWRLFLAFPLIPVVLRIVLLGIIFPFDHKNPKQLKYLCSKTYIDEINPHINLIDRLQNAENAIKQNKTYKQKGQRTFKVRFILGIVLMISNQVTGINAIIMYLKQLINKIFQTTSSDPYFLQVIMCAIALTQILATMWATNSIQRQGRKKMIIDGQIQVIIILIAIYFSDNCLRYLLSDSFTNYIVVSFIMAHIVVHNRGLGSMCIIYCADILDNLNWMIISIKICSFTVSMTSEYMIQYLGISNMFIIFAILSSIAHMIVRKWIKQTKNLSKEQIFELFEQKNQNQAQVIKRQKIN